MICRLCCRADLIRCDRVQETASGPNKGVNRQRPPKAAGEASTNLTLRARYAEPSMAIVWVYVT